MRIQIISDVGKGITLPINYNHLLVGIIYRFLSASNPEYADFLHDEGYSAAEKRFKLFTFSQLMADNRRIHGDQIFFGSQLIWYVSSPVETFLSHFADKLLTQGVISFGKHQLKIIDVRIPRIPRIQSEMNFRCISPIVMSTVRENKGKLSMHYCLYDDPKISELIRHNLIHKYQAIYDHAPSNNDLQFEFDEQYIERKQGRVSRLVDFKGIKIRGILCPFRVVGSPELIQIGYECGFGDKNSAGFGMVEVFT